MFGETVVSTKLVVVEGVVVINWEACGVLANARMTRNDVTEVEPIIRQFNLTSVGPVTVAVKLILLLLICAVVWRSANIALMVIARPSVNAEMRQPLMTASGN